MKTSKKILALAMAAAIMGSTVTVHAGDAGNDTEGNGGGCFSSDFSVTAEMLGGNLVVTVPDSMTLDYSQENANFSKTAQVNAKGNINPSKKLEVTVPTAITYSHSDNRAITADGTLSFGVTDGDNQKETWSAEDLKNAGTSGVDKDITSTVPFSEVEYVGDYTSLISYNFRLVNVDGTDDTKDNSGTTGDITSDPDFVTLKPTLSYEGVPETATKSFDIIIVSDIEAVVNSSDGLLLDNEYEDKKESDSRYVYKFLVNSNGTYTFEATPIQGGDPATISVEVNCFSDTPSDGNPPSIDSDGDKPITSIDKA